MPENKRVIALGFFDGVHLGHAALLNRTLAVAKDKGLRPAVMTFDAHPDNLVAGREVVPLINSPEDRADIIRRIFGIEDVIFLHFDEAMMRMDWREFIDNLASDFCTRHLVAGHDFSFGYRGEGDAQKLTERCRELGLGCDIIPEVRKDGRIISSTFIRTLIAEGNMPLAEEYLGHPYCLSDTVHFGYRFGRTIDAPTINMYFATGVLVPTHGVYATWVYLDDGSHFMGVTNVGVRPTVGGTDKVTAESFILDFDGNLYGRKVRVEFVKMLRPEKKFQNTLELKKQIHRDAETVRALLEK